MLWFRSTLLVAAVGSLVLGESLPEDVADKFGAKCPGGEPPQFELSVNASSKKVLLIAALTSPVATILLRPAPNPMFAPKAHLDGCGSVCVCACYLNAIDLSLLRAPPLSPSRSGCCFWRAAAGNFLTQPAATTLWAPPAHSLPGPPPGTVGAPTLAV